MPRMSKKLPPRDIVPGTFPTITSAEVGFHHPFNVDREKTIAEAQAAAATLSAERVASDPVLAVALHNLRARVGWMDLRASQPGKEHF